MCRNRRPESERPRKGHVFQSAARVSLRPSLGDQTAGPRMAEGARLVCGQACVNASAFTSAQEIVKWLVHAATIGRAQSPQQDRLRGFGDYKPRKGQYRFGRFVRE